MKLMWSIYSVTVLIFLLGIIVNNYFVYYTYFFEFIYHVSIDNPDTFIQCFIIQIYTDSEFVTIFPTNTSKEQKNCYTS